MIDPDDGEQTFEVNGQVYRSLDDVPQPFRDTLAAMLADRDGDGVPDAFADDSTHVIRHTVQRFDVDGVAYSSIEEIPEPHRTQVAEALRRSGTELGSVGGTASAPMRATRATPIVTSAGWSARSKMLLAFLMIDAIAVAVIVWLVTR